MPVHPNSPMANIELKSPGPMKATIVISITYPGIDMTVSVTRMMIESTIPP